VRIDLQKSTAPATHPLTQPFLRLFLLAPPLPPPPPHRPRTMSSRSSISRSLPSTGRSTLFRRRTQV
jgi:hypothetical protein